MSNWNVSLDTFDPVVNSSSFPEPGYIIFLLIFAFSSPILRQRPFVQFVFNLLGKESGEPEPTFVVRVMDFADFGS